MLCGSSDISCKCTKFPSAGPPPGRTPPPPPAARATRTAPPFPGPGPPSMAGSVRPASSGRGRGRLVQDDERHGRDEHGDQGHLPLHPARHPGEGDVEVDVELPGEGVASARPAGRGGRRGTAPAAGRSCPRTGGVRPAGRRRAVRTSTDCAPAVEPGDRGRTGRRSKEPEDEAEGRRLPRPVRADRPTTSPGRDGREANRGRDGAVVLGQRRGGEEGVGHGDKGNHGRTSVGLRLQKR